MEQYDSNCKDKGDDEKCKKVKSFVDTCEKISINKELKDLSNIDQDLSGAKSAAILILEDNKNNVLDLSKVSIPKLGIHILGSSTNLYVKSADVSKTIPTIVFNSHTIFDGDFTADTIFVSSFEGGKVKSNRVITKSNDDSFKNIEATQKQLYLLPPLEIKVDEEKFLLESRPINYKDNVGIVVSPFSSKVDSQIKMTLEKNCKEDSTIDIHFDDPFSSILFGFLDPDDMDIVVKDNYFSTTGAPVVKFEFDKNKWEDSKLKINLIASPKSKNFLNTDDIPEKVMGEAKEDNTFDPYIATSDPDEPEKTEHKDTGKPSTNISDVPTASSDENKSSKTGLIIGVVVVVIVALGAVVGAIVYKKFWSKSGSLSDV
ncbi:hypothetical protein GPJ56_001896 [Histomonas meleagridis]|uniref:uncharacterized protein n=1 Tax=Histomonas meleagridis TaxID=135588 RepID=UPI003559456A|nr:hypothetical protein GPJ56_001896 [Histomonas meleagridis]KAH0803165.1 hypothetical protein GO595_003901 [Histomonas meleagridis]